MWPSQSRRGTNGHIKNNFFTCSSLYGPWQDEAGRHFQMRCHARTGNKQCSKFRHAVYTLPNHASPLCRAKFRAFTVLITFRRLGITIHGCADLQEAQKWRGLRGKRVILTDAPVSHMYPTRPVKARRLCIYARLKLVPFPRTSMFSLMRCGQSVCPLHQSMMYAQMRVCSHLRASRHVSP